MPHSARRHHRLLGLRGTLGSDARPRINGHPWDSPEALALIKNAAGDDASLEADEGLERDPEVLREIGRRFGGRLALDADVARGGTVRMGDEVLLERPGDP